jgi:hypothetical protein
VSAVLLTFALLATPIILVGYPPAGPLAIVVTVNLLLWRRRAARLRAQRDRARARTRERRSREFIAAARYFR